MKKNIEDMDELEVHAFLGRGFLFWAVLITGVCIGATTLTYCMRPTWLGMERKANVESHQYVEARKAEIIADIQQYDELETRIAQNSDNAKVADSLRMQQRSVKRKIQAAMAKIPQDSWPEGAGRFQ